MANSTIPDAETLVAEFRAELPWHLQCSEKVAEVSAYTVRKFLREQKQPFPECFTYESAMAWLQRLAATPPRHRNKQAREASTVNNHLKALKRLAKWAIARDFITENPVAKIKGLREADRMIFAPDPDTVRHLLRIAIGHGSNQETKARNFAMLALLIDVGPRAGEIGAMNVNDVLDSRGNIRDVVTLHGKGNRDRVVAINPMLREALAEYLPLRRPIKGEPALWVTDAGTRMTYPAFRGVVQRICEKAGVKVALHDFRRFALTQMFAQDISQISGMAISGHRRADVYLRYIRGAIQERAVREHRQFSPLDAVRGAAAV